MDEGRAVCVRCLTLGEVFDRISCCTAVSRLARHGEEGQRDGEGLEHLPQEERPRGWALSLLAWSGHWGHPLQLLSSTGEPVAVTSLTPPA